MKKLAIICIIATIMVGCENDPVRPAPANIFKATIDGKSWTGLGRGLRTKRFGVEEATVTGARLNDDNSFLIALEGITQPGDYKIEGENEFTTPRFATYTSGRGTYYAEKGLLKIVEISEGSAKGEFTFMAINPDAPAQPDTVMITQGEFDVALQRFP